LKSEYISAHKNGKEYIFLSPDDLNVMEEPCILHPYFDYPEEHLIFDKHGNVSAKDNSEKGIATIKVFGLDNDELVAERLQEVKVAKSDFYDTISKEEDFRSIYRLYKEGRKPYSASVLSYFKHLKEKTGVIFDV
jgi:hypothetical protein